MPNTVFVLNQGHGNYQCQRSAQQLVNVCIQKRIFHISSLKIFIRKENSSPLFKLPRYCSLLTCCKFELGRMEHLQSCQLFLILRNRHSQSLEIFSITLILLIPQVEMENTCLKELYRKTHRMKRYEMYMYNKEAGHRK